DRQMAEALHQLVSEKAPMLLPRTFYGMPAYYLGDKNVLFFQSGIKFKTRYCTLGFSQAAVLDEEQMWPTSFAITEWTPAVAARIGELLLKATSTK
ncbi:MAG: hypothetical protein KGL72_05185, partial [Actinomycetales bacterium]|nr:hypothetical protein [Actinomycetales bacterium]